VNEQPAAGSSSGLRRAVEVLAELVRSDILIRYGRGRIRFLKWLLDPIAALGIYLLLVALVLDRGGNSAGLSLVCAIVPFQLVMMSVINALQAVGLRGSIILNMRFPRTLIPASSVVTESVVLTASLTLIPLMMIIYGVAPTVSILWLVPAFAAALALAIGLAYPAALFGVWYPELMPLAVSLIRAMFFLAPGLVALDQVTGSAHDLLPLNPLTGLFESFRDALLFGQAPAAWELLVPFGVGAALFAIAYPVYRSEQSELAKLLG